MTQPVHLIGNTFTMQVPEGANHFSLHENLLQWFAQEDGKEQPQLLILAGNSWSIVGKPLELSEEECGKIVEKCYDLYYRDYSRRTLIDRVFGDEFFNTTAIASLISLLKSKSLQPETTLLINKMEV